jgi:hypothetical protein
MIKVGGICLVKLPLLACAISSILLHRLQQIPQKVEERERERERKEGEEEEEDSITSQSPQPPQLLSFFFFFFLGLFFVPGLQIRYQKNSREKKHLFHFFFFKSRDPEFIIADKDSAAAAGGRGLECFKPNKAALSLLCFASSSLVWDPSWVPHKTRR